MHMIFAEAVRNLGGRIRHGNLLKVEDLDLLTLLFSGGDAVINNNFGISIPCAPPPI